MYARPEEYRLDVPDADGVGDPFPCRRLAQKCVQFGPFDGTLRLLATSDEVNWPAVHEEVGDGTGEGTIIPLELTVRAVRVERAGLTGDPPTVTLSGLLVG